MALDEIPDAPVGPAKVRHRSAPLAIAGNHAFREEARAAYLRDDGEARPLRAAPPWAGQVLAAGFVLIASAVVGGLVARVEVTARGPGVLRAEGGAQMLTLPVAGTVAEVHARSGERVAAGQIVITLASAPLRASLIEAERKLIAARAELEDFEKRRAPLLEARRRQLDASAEILGQRAIFETEGAARTSARAARTARLADAGLGTASEEDRAFEEVSGAEGLRLETSERLERTRGEIAALDLERATEAFRRKAEVEDAIAHRNGVAVALEQMTVRAARAGTLEAVLVRPGDQLAAGTAVGKLVPADVPLQIVAFVAERDRAFLNQGAEARVEMDQLPIAEFGTLHATVTRIAEDIASEPELKDALGERASGTEALYRVELALSEDARRSKLRERIRPGSVVVVRYVLRRRNLATVVLAPLVRAVQ